MNFDPEVLKQLIATFKSELDEQAQVITNGLIQLEKGEQAEEDQKSTIEGIFRAAHNIKGASRGLGINHVADIAHHIESLFSAIQKKSIKMSTPIVDICLDAVDKMQSAMQSFLENKPLSFEISLLLDGLKQQELQKNVNTTVTKSKEELPKPESAKATMDVKGSDSIRVSINSIDRISALMEEMQGNKIAIDDHYADLVQLMHKTKQFEDVWKQITYFMKSHINKSSGDSLQKLYYSGQDYFNEMSSSTSQLYKNMRSKINDMSIVSDSLQDEIRMLRLIPISTLFGTMPRYVRELAHELNKEVEIKISGDDVKIDKLVLEKLKDPIIHLLRNCIDHGIENPDIRSSLGKPKIGVINIEITEKDGQVFINLVDDGSGLDAKKIANIALKKNLVTQNELEEMDENEILMLIFKHGFSTKEIITDISGRGIGLDVVKTNIENINGHVKIKTLLGKFTSFELCIPLTLSSERGLVVNSSKQIYVVPTSAVQRVLIAKIEDVIEVNGSQVIMVDDHPVSLRTLTDVLGFEQSDLPDNNIFSIVVLNKGEHSVAILVDEIIGEREIVIKPIQTPLSKIPCVAGGTLSGNNQVITVLEPSDLINRALKLESARRITLQADTEKSNLKPHILVVDDSITTRTLEKNILESKNYQVTVAVNGKEAWEILQKQQFSLVITDVAMPLMDGFTLTERIKHNEKLRDMPVIIVTSLGSDEEKKRGIDVGANAYIIKHEFESGALLDIVKQLV